MIVCVCDQHPTQGELLLQLLLFSFVLYNSCANNPVITFHRWRYIFQRNQ